MPTIPIARAAAHFRRAASRIAPQVVSAEKGTLKEAKADAVKLSSGPHSTAQLRAAGHPYARRAPNAAYDAAIINVQSGRFRAAWKTIAPAAGLGGIVSRLVNGSPEAKYMSGTKTTIARAVGQRIASDVQPARILRLRRALQAVFLGH